MRMRKHKKSRRVFLSKDKTDTSFIQWDVEGEAFTDGTVQISDGTNQICLSGCMWMQDTKSIIKSMEKVDVLIRELGTYKAELEIAKKVTLYNRARILQARAKAEKANKKKDTRAGKTVKKTKKTKKARRKS